MNTFQTKLAATAAIGILASCQMASATLSIVTSVGGAATGANKLNFDDLQLGSGSQTAYTPNGIIGVSFQTDGKVVSGSASQYAAPWLSGNNGQGFGSPNQANGQDATRYLTSGVDNGSLDGAAILTWQSNQKYLGLLWGSIDTYNSLEFWRGGQLIETVTGSQVTATPNGDQGLNGTRYVNITFTGANDLGFDKVVARSLGSYAFEFDNVAYSESALNPRPVPEPSTVVAGALLLLPFGASAVRILRRKQNS